jgi:hypothetical protein
LDEKRLLLVRNAMLCRLRTTMKQKARHNRASVWRQLHRCRGDLAWSRLIYWPDSADLLQLAGAQ